MDIFAAAKSVDQGRVAGEMGQYAQLDLR